MDFLSVILIVFCSNLPSPSYSQTKEQDGPSKSKYSTGQFSNHHLRKDPPEGSKIRNGQKANKDEFPYIVAISHSDNPSDNYGAGMILGSYWILTVEHVMRAGLTRGMHYVIPNYDNTVSTFKSGIKHQVSEYFCPKDKGGDIALMKLRQPIQLDQEPYKFKKINMIKSNHRLDAKKSITVAGWGYLNVSNTKSNEVPPGESSSILMKTDVQLLPDGNCSFYSGFSSPKYFCTSGEIRGSCYGDSGGPAVLKNEGNSGDMLIGLISGGFQYCNKSAFYVNVSFWRQWIDSIMDHGGYTDYCNRYQFLKQQKSTTINLGDIGN